MRYPLAGEILEHLEKGEKELEIAIGLFGPRAGALWAGSWAEYRNLVRTLLRLQDIRRKVRHYAPLP